MNLIFKILLICGLLVAGSSAFANGNAAEQGDDDTISLSIPGLGGNQPSFVPAIKIIGLLTVLSVAPALLLMMTSFTRILIVLGFVRQALGTPTMPPNQIILGLALFLTFFSMSPVIDQVHQKAYKPYSEKQIDEETAFAEFIKPVRKFMMAETREDDLAMFFSVAKVAKPTQGSEVPLTVLIPSFMLSEIKTAFQIGFLVYIPFLIIDMVVAAVLMAMGMMMLPPTVIALPFKIVLFVLVDGWSLIIGSIMKSFATG